MFLGGEGDKANYAHLLQSKGALGIPGSDHDGEVLQVATTPKTIDITATAKSNKRVEGECDRKIWLDHS